MGQGETSKVAAPKSRPRDGYPGRALALILVVTVGLVALMFGTGHTTPRLGIDLAGGTSITLTADSKDKAAINQANMNTAVGIIQQRVNGYGVSEAEVQTQGSNNIIVNIPKNGASQDEAKQVGTTAQLYFRPVLATAPTGVTVPPATSSPSAAASGSAKPSAGASASAGAGASAQPSTSAGAAGTPSAGASTAGRALSDGLKAADPSGTPGATAPSAPATGAAAAPSGMPSAPAAPQPTSPAEISAALTQGTVPADVQQQFTALDCSDIKQRSKDYQTDPTKDSVACTRDKEQGAWTKLALGPVAINGKDVSKAQAGFDTQNGAGWEVQLGFNGAGTKAFAATTGQLATQQSPANQFAIVLDGQVISHPYVSQSIVGGNAVISGSFTQDEATGLANVLSFGALPLSFVQSDVTTVTPQLGGDQLHAGLIAGAIGLLLVVLYSLIYYRGLGLVSIAGLVVSAILTYSIMCLLGAGIGFALNLPAVCGAIVAIGITADSFIVYFERIRDEVREGAPLRPAVQRAWPRARRTILVSDFVSFLCAGVLYVVSVGKVQGFAFTLGLTTLLDVVVIFLFTKPLITLLARKKFFSNGHPWSGLDPKRLGARPPVRSTRRRPATTSAVKEA
ncbi:preprotein translocase subunit SecD [Kitasatospora sp. MAA4]|uniref:protein translocase subunit SecD n=1 Tax=Kitasatospora sp. MAA4 TaxID=3035093 RepID=UPI0024733D02|nr:protein translocase subunit SecD [Kitasatospora sp. MAA4]MDH6131137.1 preprotein translocase subunit SecD [Kitasatospora sp. MAA4]